ncbi:hypothetical protein KY289_011606 [Solanum tuberosum]|nr:hypothetical protein KY289_011606 [Solanum tuberosum]
MHQARRAKEKAIAMIDGDINDQFACKTRFKAGCRKIIGVDGCWMKNTMYVAQLLSTVTLDGNNNIFSMAYAIAKKENKEIWQ